MNRPRRYRRRCLPPAPTARRSADPDAPRRRRRRPRGPPGRRSALQRRSRLPGQAADRPGRGARESSRSHRSRRWSARSRARRPAVRCVSPEWRRAATVVRPQTRAMTAARAAATSRRYRSPAGGLARRGLGEGGSVHPYELLGEALGLITPPLIAEPRPENLVVRCAIGSPQRASQQALGGRAKLAHRGVAARILRGDPRFEAVNAKRLESKAEDEAAGVFEQALAPPLRSDGNAPLGG